MRTSHILLVVFVFLTSVSALIGATLFNQSFAGSATPTNWTIIGSDSGSHTSDGIAKDDTDFFNGGQGFLRLTNNAGYERSWAYFTGGTFAMKGTWKLTAEVRLGKSHNNSTEETGADGISFVFLDAATFSSFGNVFTPSQIEGGYGEWMGAPRAAPANTTSAGNGSRGLHAGVKGFSFEFDHYNNQGEYYSEYNHWVDLTNWEHSGLGADMGPVTDFYYNNSWQQIQLEANNGVITYSYRWNGTSYLSTLVMNTNSPVNGSCTSMYPYNAYLGICGSTGGQTAFHDVRNVKLDSDDITLPLQMSSFSATTNSYNTATLQWVTYAETNLSGYNLYRGNNDVFNESTNLNVFIPAANSSQPVTYEYIDSEVNIGGTYYYWVQSRDLDGTINLFGPAYVLIQGDNPTTPGIPATQGITSIYPNPFGPSTTIKFGIEKTSNTSLQIFNSRGQIIRSLRQQPYQPGEYSLVWDGKDDAGKTCSTGVYTLRMISGTDVSSRRLVIIK